MSHIPQNYLWYSTVIDSDFVCFICKQLTLLPFPFSLNRHSPCLLFYHFLTRKFIAKFVTWRLCVIHVFRLINTFKVEETFSTWIVVSFQDILKTSAEKRNLNSFKSWLVSNLKHTFSLAFLITVVQRRRPLTNVSDKYVLSKFILLLALSKPKSTSLLQYRSKCFHTPINWFFYFFWETGYGHHCDHENLNLQWKPTFTHHL